MTVLKLVLESLAGNEANISWLDKLRLNKLSYSMILSCFYTCADCNMRLRSAKINRLNDNLNQPQVTKVVDSHPTFGRTVTG